MKFRILHFHNLPSTNTLAVQYASEGAPEGLVIVADYQTSGRGKPGRQWLSPQGKNLLFSVILRPPVRAHEAPLLTQIVCRSVAEVLKKSYHIASTFKRPNDVMVQGKKICGVLIESSSTSKGAVEAAVIGIGLNVNAVPGKFRVHSISLADLTGKTCDKEIILKKILIQLKKDLGPIYGNPA